MSKEYLHEIYWSQLMQYHENLVFIAKATGKGSDEPAHR